MKIEKNTLTDEIFDFDEEFGLLHFIGLRSTSMVPDDNGNPTDVVRKRVYNLLSDKKRKVIQVGVSGEDSSDEISFAPNTVVKLVNPTLSLIPFAEYPESRIVETLSAADIVAANGVNKPPVGVSPEHK